MSNLTATENKQLLQEIFADLAEHRPRRFAEAMADSFRWTVIGTTRWSGTFEGKAAVQAELLSPLRARLGQITTVAHRFFADGDHVVVEARGANRTIEGEAYENTYCFVFRLEAGKLCEVTEYCDTDLVARVLGERAVPAAT